MRKSIITIFICLCCLVTIRAQDSLSLGDMSIADASPQFPGGEAAMIKFIIDSTNYPKMEMDSNIQGRVVVRFDVAVDGSIENIRIVKSISPGLDAEAVRVIRSMPKWIPPTWNGKKIRSGCVLPFTFSLDVLNNESK